MSIDLTPRKYRIVLHDVPAEQKNIETIVREELGDVVVREWEVEREIDYSLAACYFGYRDHKAIIVSLVYNDLREQSKSNSVR